jgi:hypothetical protein
MLRDEDQPLSFTDCASFACMKHLGIREPATTDTFRLPDSSRSLAPSSTLFMKKLPTKIHDGSRELGSIKTG